MKIAYVILAHKQPELLERMFKLIYRPGNFYVIHIDKKSNQYFNQCIQSLNSYKNVYFINSVSCVWGSFSIVKAQLEGIKRVLQAGPWDFVINLSGQDFPLKSQENIIDELRVFKGHNLVDIIDQQNDWPQSLYRIANYHLVLGNRLINSRIKRSLPKKFKPFAGSQWFILSRDFCEHLFESPLSQEIIKFYKRTAIPDEAVIQTIIMNSPFKNTVVNNNKRTLQFEPETSHPKIWTESDFECLVQSGNFFARKFDYEVDNVIIDKLESHLQK